MALKQKTLDPDEEALAVIIQDPILFPEFLRNTKDGNPNKELWPKDRFKYRHYQRDLLTDQNHYISLVGGRAIGKCMYGMNRVYTSKGYKRHSELNGKKFLVYALDENNRLVLRRGYCEFDGIKTAYHIETKSGKTILCTKIHPILTPEGYKLAGDIKIGDLAAVITKLPQLQSASYPYHDVRLLGYLYGQATTIKKSQSWIPIKSRRAVEELRAIALKMDMYFDVNHMNEVRFRFKHGQGAHHPLLRLFGYFNIEYLRRYNDKNTLPPMIMEFNEENLKAFLEAYLSQYAELKARSFKLYFRTNYQAEQFQELFLRFGIETRIEHTKDTVEISNKDRYYYRRENVTLVNVDYRASYRLWQLFDIPGFSIDELSLPEPSYDATDFYRFEPIVRKESKPRRSTYALQVEGLNNYISEDVLVHNSLVLEDRLLYQIFNHDTELPEKAEMLLTTANQAQMTPILDSINTRLLSSPMLKHFYRGLNGQKGTLDFLIGKDVRLYSRIAGMKSENNVIALHLTNAYIDEGQVYSLGTFTQLTPIINTWQTKYGIFAAGVPNGITNCTLYRVDQRSKKYKRYRVPATQNPYYSYGDYVQALRDYGGDEDDRFQNLVLGKWGTGSQQVISRDQMDIQSYDFYTLRYTSQQKLQGAYYTELMLPPLNEYSALAAGIDAGFVEPTIIQIFGLKAGKWYSALRIKLQRIEFPEQEQIIHWLHQKYSFVKIALDIGAGGGGATILQSLCSRPEYKSYQYDKIIKGVTFNEGIVIGYNPAGLEIKQDTKGLAAQELVLQLQNKQIVLSEIDNEGISELERIAKQRGITGVERYFILSEKGSGASKNDHIFAAYLCFAMLTRDTSVLKKKKKLGKAKA